MATTAARSASPGPATATSVQMLSRRQVRQLSGGALLAYLRANEDGEHLTTSQAASAIGMDERFIRQEIQLGELRGLRVGRRGRRPTYRIEFRELKRYLSQMGIL